MIPYGRQDITQADIDAVIGVLQSDFLTQGQEVNFFEEKIAKYCDAKYAVAVNSATSALHIACLALGLREKDLVWTTPITFVASANCALYCGAQIDFVDINPVTLNLCINALAEKLEKSKSLGRLPKIVIPVHFAGTPCDMEAIYLLSKKYGFKIIEDASHAIGARYQGEVVGKCQFSDITIFSFHPVKIITTGEGGAAVTNQSKLADKMSMLRSHGITRDPMHMSRTPVGPWYYEQNFLGFNYRMTDIQAALGISQMNRLDKYISRRHEISDRYSQLLIDLPVTLPLPSRDSALHLYVIRLNLEAIKKSFLEIFNAIRAGGVGVNVHYIPVHLQPYFSRLGFSVGDFPEAEKYYKEAISIPIYPKLTEAELIKVSSVIKSAILE
jgi:UDP-4-amino-4,6-dideoxy-N-acetyl-beta-L-altrosamine transaminase